MGCVVYCLAPSPADTARMVARAREAGIPSSDVRVIDHPRNTVDYTRLAVHWWGTPAALWWMGMCTWPAMVRACIPPASEALEIIALDDYRTRGAAR